MVRPNGLEDVAAELRLLRELAREIDQLEKLYQQRASLISLTMQANNVLRARSAYQEWQKSAR